MPHHEIKNRDGTILFSCEGESLKHCLEVAVKQTADLSGADLRRAFLSGADLRRAFLSGADLSGAFLSGADLRRALLTGADLSGAFLRRADLSRAFLTGADLSGADLRGADLSGAVIETGESWEQYLTDVVPALIAAGGHPVSPEAWACHNWGNCPMSEAFAVHAVQDVPPLLRPRVEQFIRFFDARLIPAPTV